MAENENRFSNSPAIRKGHPKRGPARWFAGVVPATLLVAAGAYAAAGGAHAPGREQVAAGGTTSQTTNAFCPVMPEMSVDPAVFTDYRGKRVYFCCPSCKVKFTAEPLKYLAALPQFAGVPVDAAHDHGAHGSGVTAAGLIKPAGIATLCLLVLTVAAALLRRKRPGLLRWHKRLGIATLSCAALHALIVLIAH